MRDDRNEGEVPEDAVNSHAMADDRQHALSHRFSPVLCGQRSTRNATDTRLFFTPTRSEQDARPATALASCDTTTRKHTACSSSQTRSRRRRVCRKARVGRWSSPPRSQQHQATEGKATRRNSMVKKAYALSRTRSHSVCSVSLRSSGYSWKELIFRSWKLYRSGKLQHRSGRWCYIRLQAAICRPPFWPDWHHDANPRG